MKRQPDRNTNEISDLELVSHLYGDADDPEAVEAALERSDELRRAFEEFHRTLELVDSEPVPTRPSDYGLNLWQEIESRLDDAERPAPILTFPGSKRSERIRWFGLAAAAVVLLGVGFWLGRLQTVPPVEVPQLVENQGGELSALSSRARELLLVAELSDHLGRSERLLMELANDIDRNPTEAELERVWATELLVSNRLCRRAAESAGQTRIARLLTELEPLLLELAHADSGLSTDQTNAERIELRRRVDERGLLLKVRVTGRRLETPTLSDSL
ncbi:MAG: hypothetical protein MPN21_09400 [Thermoanaerobaculia bacterium]|nr:hypothetical protein [Thermoanaerobaculia bacterium]